ncbi:probable glutamate receptor [Penaeus japonicus]|uniref:probable glutamate receptor n=1 Tax=Penaeus japonicus TaxID=27405 RepID=UPI001C711304|nr:probable glutamate receptor [Penaeus japonicus]
MTHLESIKYHVIIQSHRTPRALSIGKLSIVRFMSIIRGLLSFVGITLMTFLRFDIHFVSLKPPACSVSLKLMAYSAASSSELVDNGGPSSPAWQRWLHESFPRLSQDSGSYVAVAGGSKGRDGATGASCGEEEQEQREVLPAGVTRQGLRRNHDGTEPLLVAPLLSPADAASLGKLSQGDLRLRPWLLLCHQGFEDLIGSLHFPLDNLVVLAVLGDTDANITLWEAYQPAPDLPQRLTFLGAHPVTDYDAANDSDWDSCPSFSRDPWARRRDLSGLTVRCSTVEEEPFIYHRRLSDGIVVVSGTYGDLWNILARELNFTGVCRVPPDGEWGSLRDGVWTGAVGQVVRGEADVAVAAMDHTYERAKVVDFPFGISLYSYSLVIKRPSSLDHMWTNYVREFTADAWTVAVASLLLSAFCLALVGCLSPCEKPFSPGDAAMTTLASFCNSGYVLDLRSGSGRLAFASLYALTILLYAHYSSFLFSSLTVQKATPPFRDLAEMHAKGTHTLGLESGGALEDYLKYSKDETIRAVWRDLVRHQDLSVSQSFGLVTSGSHAFMLSRAQYFSKYQSCELKMLPLAYFSTQSSWPMPKNSSLLPVFRYHLRNLVHSGLYQRSVQHWRPRSHSCGNTLAFEPMGHQQVITAFILLSCAVLLALSLLMAERMWRVVSCKRGFGAPGPRRQGVAPCDWM